MSQQNSPCPDAEALHDFLMDQSSSEKSVRIESHILQCRRCIEAMSNLNVGNVTADALHSLAANGQSLDPSQVRPFVARLKAALRSENAVFERATIDVAGDGAGSASVGNAHHQIDFLTPPESDDEIGRLGSYRILEVLGKGGMGMVFRAQDTQLDRMVALKVMLPALAADESARQRFLREAKATAALEHDNIVSIHQVGAVNGVPFIAMPLLKGHALDSILKKGKRLGIPHILRIALQTAQGLAAAHEAGLVHRDIKPSNLWIEPDGGGRVKIVDFGLARASTADKEQGRDEMRLTKTGVILGTPAYMAPEQARSEGEIDHRCDLFSLGCVLYELCTGELPFRGADITAVLLSLVMDDPLPPHKIRDEIPMELSDFVMKLLSKEPADRPQTANDAAAAIRKLQKQIASRRESPADTTEAVPQSSLPEPSMPTLALTARQTAVDPLGGNRRRRWLIFVAVLLLLGPLAFFFGPSVIRFAFNQGQLVIETDEHIKVTLLAGGKKIEVFDTKTKQTYTITAGRKYKLRIKQMPDGVNVETDVFKLARGGRMVFDARVELAKARPQKQPIEKKETVPKTKAKEPNGEWSPIFNGKDLSGLKVWFGPGNWAAKQGKLIGKGTSAIATTKTYRDYHLQFDARLTTPEKKSSFSLYQHANRLGAPKNLSRFTNYNLIMGLGSVAVGRMKIQRTPRTWVGPGPANERAEKAVKPGWNTFDIVSKDGSVRVEINKTETAKIPSGYGFLDNGLIGFSVNGDVPIEFRNIRIKVFENKPPAEPGWTTLFNGKDLTGWKNPTGQCRVFQGVLQVVGRGAAYSERTHSRHCIIRLEFRASPAADGVVRIHDTIPGFRLGDYERLGDKQLAALAKPLGEWNELEIACTGRLHAKIKFNGQALAKDIPIGKDYEDGLSLHVTTGKIEFRNLRIKDLGPQKLAHWLAKLEHKSPLNLRLRCKIPIRSYEDQLTFLNGGKYLLTRSSAYFTPGFLWDTATGRPVWEETAMRGIVHSDEHKLLAYHTQQKPPNSPVTMHIAPLPGEKGKSVTWLVKQSGTPRYTFVPKQPFLAMYQGDTLRFRHLQFDKVLLTKLDGTLQQLEFSSDGTRVATRTSKTIAIWDWQKNKQLWSMPNVNKKFHVVAGDLLAVWAEGGPYLLRKFSNGELHDVLKIDEILDVSPNGKKLLVRRGRPTLYTQDGKLVGPLKEPNPPINKGPSDIMHSFSGDGNWILALRSSGQFHVLIWSVQSQECVQSIDLPFSYAGCNFAMSNDGKSLAIAVGTSFEAAQGDREGMVYVFDIAQEGP